MQLHILLYIDDKRCQLRRSATATAAAEKQVLVRVDVAHRKGDGVLGRAIAEESAESLSNIGLVSHVQTW